MTATPNPTVPPPGGPRPVRGLSPLQIVLITLGCVLGVVIVGMTVINSTPFRALVYFSEVDLFEELFEEPWETTTFDPETMDRGTEPSEPDYGDSYTQSGERDSDDNVLMGCIDHSTGDTSNCYSNEYYPRFSESFRREHPRP